MDTLWQLESNIDDMNPQNMEYVFSLILAQGANDVWAMPMMMKTTSIGVRFFPVTRLACDRLITTVRVDGRDLHCKVCRYDGKVVNISAEYDDCRAAAAETGTPLKDWQRKVKEAAYRQFAE